MGCVGEVQIKRMVEQQQVYFIDATNRQKESETHLAGMDYAAALEALEAGLESAMKTQYRLVLVVLLNAMTFGTVVLSLPNRVTIQFDARCVCLRGAGTNRFKRM